MGRGSLWGPLGLGTPERLWRGWALQEDSEIARSRATLSKTLALSTPGVTGGEFRNWALQGDSLRLGTPVGTPGSGGWAIQGKSGAALGVGQSRLGTFCQKTLGLGTPGVSGWVGHSRESLGLGTRVGHSRSVWGWALQEVSEVGHFRESLGWALQGVSRSRGEELSLKSSGESMHRQRSSLNTCKPTAQPPPPPPKKQNPNCPQNTQTQTQK